MHRETHHMNPLSPTYPNKSALYSTNLKEHGSSTSQSRVVNPKSIPSSIQQHQLLELQNHNEQLGLDPSTLSIQSIPIDEELLDVGCMVVEMERMANNGKGIEKILRKSFRKSNEKSNEKSNGNSYGKNYGKGNEKSYEKSNELNYRKRNRKSNKVIANRLNKSCDTTHALGTFNNLFDIFDKIDLKINSLHGWRSVWKYILSGLLYCVVNGWMLVYIFLSYIFFFLIEFHKTNFHSLIQGLYTVDHYIEQWILNMRQWNVKTLEYIEYKYFIQSQWSHNQFESKIHEFDSKMGLRFRLSVVLDRILNGVVGVLGGVAIALGSILWLFYHEMVKLYKLIKNQCFTVIKSIIFLPSLLSSPSSTLSSSPTSSPTSLSTISSSLTTNKSYNPTNLYSNNKVVDEVDSKIFMYSTSQIGSIKKYRKMIHEQDNSHSSLKKLFMLFGLMRDIVYEFVSLSISILQIIYEMLISVFKEIFNRLFQNKWYKLFMKIMSVFKLELKYRCIKLISLLKNVKNAKDVKDVKNVKDVKDVGQMKRVKRLKPKDVKYLNMKHKLLLCMKIVFYPLVIISSLLIYNPLSAPFYFITFKPLFKFLISPLIFNFKKSVVKFIMIPLVKVIISILGSKIKLK